MAREGFNFLVSQYRMYCEMETDEERVSFINAIFNKQFYNKEPDLKNMPKLARIAYLSEKHALDKSIKGYEQKTGQVLAATFEATSAATCQEVQVQVQEEVQVQEKGEVEEAKQNPPPPSNVFDLIKTEVDKLREINQWHESTAMSIGLTYYQMQRLLDDFPNHIIAQNKRHREILNDKFGYAGYFANYARGRKNQNMLPPKEYRDPNAEIELAF